MQNHYPWYMLGYCIRLRHWHVEYYIDWSFHLSSHIDYPYKLTLRTIWLLCSPWHVHSFCCLSHSSWHVWFSWLYIIIIIMEHAILARYSSRLSYFMLSLCVDLDDIHVLCMTAYCITSFLLHDACVACLCGTHTYPLVSKSLVLVNLVSLYLVFDTRLVILFALRLS